MCSRKRFEMVARGASKRVFTEGVDINPKALDEIPAHGCWENLSGAVKPWNISPDDVPSPFNIFQCMRIDPETGILYDTMVRPKDEAHVDFRAEMDCLVAVKWRAPNREKDKRFALRSMMNRSSCDGLGPKFQNVKSCRISATPGAAKATCSGR